MRSVPTWLWRGFAGLTVIFMLTPLVLVVLFSFGESTLTNFPMGGVTVKWYVKLARNQEFWNALNNSLTVAGSVALASTVVGTLAALAIARLRPPIAGPWLIVLSLPMMMPPLVVAVALLVYYTQWLDVSLGLQTVIISHLVITQPFVILVVFARMVSFDYAMIDSARDLGASPWKAFSTVTLPIISTTIIGAALLALAISLDDFVITFFTIGGGNTLPTFVWGMIRTKLDPSINAIATILITLTTGSTMIAIWFSRYRG